MRLSAPVHRLKRKARLLSREAGIPLHEALDLVARKEGFHSWSLLAVRASQPSDARELFAQLEAGDLLLLGARPGQGKTMMGLALAVEAIAHGRNAVFFTLEYTERETRERLERLGRASAARIERLSVVASDDISSAGIIDCLSPARPGTVAVIDYLQILDQKRTKPELARQVADLRSFASDTGAIIAFLAQIDRRYDPAVKRVPDVADVRLPNPIDLSAFSKTCFMHAGRIACGEIT